MMTIVMYCDRCGIELKPDVRGAGRVRLGPREWALHLCPAHQEEMRELIFKFCADASPREVKQPSRSGRADV